MTLKYYYLKAALVMGLLMGLKVVHCTEAECLAHPACPASKDQWAILYQSRALHENQFPCDQRTGCTGCRYKAFHWWRTTAGCHLLLQISGYLKAPSSGRRRGWLTKHLYL